MQNHCIKHIGGIFIILFCWACASPPGATKSPIQQTSVAAPSRKGALQKDTDSPSHSTERPIDSVVKTATSVSSASHGDNASVKDTQLSSSWLQTLLSDHAPSSTIEVRTPVSAIYVDNDTAVLALDKNGIFTLWTLPDNKRSAPTPIYGALAGRSSTYGNPTGGKMISVSPDRTLSVVNGDVFCIDHEQQTTRRLELERASSLMQVATSADEQLLLVGSDTDGRMNWHLYGLPEHCMPIKYNSASISIDVAPFKKGKVTTGAFDRTNRYLALGTSHGYIFLWKRDQLRLPTREAPGFSPHRTLGKPHRILGPTPRGVTNIEFLSEDTIVAGTYDGDVNVWRVDQQNRRKPNRQLRMRGSYAQTLAVNPARGTIAAGGFDGSIWLWASPEEEPIVESSTHAAPITGLSFSTDGNGLLSASLDGVFAIWHSSGFSDRKFNLQTTFGVPHRPLISTDMTTDACGIAEAEMKKALFYLTDEERRQVAGALLREWIDEPEEILERFKCVRNQNESAWGLIPHDVNGEKNAFKIWLLYVDKDGNKLLGGRHHYWSEGNYGLDVHGYTYYDWDGDGIQEVMWTSGYWDKEDYSSDGADDIFNIKTFNNGVITDYPLKQKAQRASDMNGDGVPDLIIRPFYSVTISSCGHSSEASHPVGPDVVSFASPQGAFFASGDLAEEYYREYCPVNQPISTDVQNGSVIDNDKLRRNIVCAVLWGNSEKKIQGEINRFCKNKHITSSCMDEIWFAPLQNGCIGVQHLLEIATAKAPLVLK